ncbi:MAG TPA: hypothetical protein VGG36_03740 [Rhizomicrobium sp.]|jgi:hypothetical protein
MKWAVAGLLLLAPAAQGADYSRMAPVGQYMMNGLDEVALAKSAAPASISDKATILVLTPRGYQTAIKGSNGFVCAVERSWMAQYEFPQFWNPHMRGPLCYNPIAVRDILPYTIRRTALVLSGVHDKAALDAAIKSDMARHALPALEPGALTYMMSKQQYLNDGARAWVPHLMFYFPRASGAEWGADLAGAPPMLNPQFQRSAEQISVLMVPVTHWSDGTPAPKM